MGKRFWGRAFRKKPFPQTPSKTAFSFYYRHIFGLLPALFLNCGLLNRLPSAPVRILYLHLKSLFFFYYTSIFPVYHPFHFKPVIR